MTGYITMCTGDKKLYALLIHVYRKLHGLYQGLGWKYIDLYGLTGASYISPINIKHAHL